MIGILCEMPSGINPTKLGCTPLAFSPISCFNRLLEFGKFSPLWSQFLNSYRREEHFEKSNLAFFKFTSIIDGEIKNLPNSSCYLKAKYHSLVGRRGKKRALIAVGHKILIMCYELLKHKVPYRELGADFLDKRKKDKVVRSYVNRLTALGYEVTVKQAA